MSVDTSMSQQRDASDVQCYPRTYAYVSVEQEIKDKQAVTYSEYMRVVGEKLALTERIEMLYKIIDEKNKQLSDATDKITKLEKQIGLNFDA